MKQKAQASASHMRLEKSPKALNPDNVQPGIQDQDNNLPRPRERSRPTRSSVSPVKDQLSEYRPTYEHYFKEITAAWLKSLAAILATAKLCAEASDVLEESDVARLANDLPFDPSTFSKLVKVAKFEPFSSPEVQAQLPANYSILYQMTLLGQDGFDQALKAGHVHPKVKREEIDALRKPIKTADDEAKRHFGSVFLSETGEDSDLDELEGALKNALERFGGEFVRRRSDDEMAQDKQERELLKVQEKAYGALRKLVRRRIREHRAQVRRNSKGLSNEEKKQRWPWSDGELEVGPRDGPEQIRKTLGLLDLDSELGPLMEKAGCLARLPDLDAVGWTLSRREEWEA